MKKLVVLTLSLFLSISAIAQEIIKEGVLTAKQTMSSDNDLMNTQLQSMGETTSKIYFKDNKSRSEISSPMTGDMSIIMDGAEKQMLMLMDQPTLGKKYILKSTDLTAEDIENVKVEKGSEIKTVLGYDCQQYKIVMKQNGQEVEMEMFTTDKISAISQNTTAIGDKVEGFPLYYVLKMQQMGATIAIISEVTNIDKTSVSEDKFTMTPPEGYTKMEGM